MRHRVEALALAAYLVSATRLWALEPGSKPGSVVDGHPVLEVTPAAVLEKGDGAAVGDLKRPAITAIDALGGTTPNKVQNFVNEVEPNGTVATANFLSGTSGVVSGNVYPNADEDYFAINGTVGDRIYVATMTFFSASGSSNSQLYVYRSDGTTLIEFDEDDGSLGGLASTIAGATLLDTGVSYIRVKHMSAAGQIRPYRLYYQVRTGATAPEIEPNDTTTNATPLVTGWANGSINPAADADFYSFNMNAGDTAYLSLDLDPERDGTTWNGVVGICCFDNYILTVNDASVTSPNSEATFMTALTTGTYYAFVTENASGGAPTDTYHLSVTINPRAPQTGCTTYTSTDVPKAIPAAGGNVTSTLTVPGNPRIDDLSVVLNLNHAAMPDLDVTLISPKNNNNGLFIDEPAPPAGVTLFNQVLSDSAGIPINAYGVFAGMMGEPQGFGATGFRLGWFYGENAGGTWTLSLTDDTNNASGGTLNSWGLTVCTPSAPSGCGPNSYQATPFTTDFEANNGGFTHSGTQDEWAWGLPNNPPINDCNGGVGCWKTDLLGTYNASSTQDLLSPGISLAGLSSPIRVSWSQKYQMESTSFDHAFVDVREVGNPANAKRLWEWLDTTMTVTQGATLIQESAGWADYTADISSFAGLNVELRFHVDSDTTGQYAGLAIDDVTVTGCATCQAITLSPGTLPSGVVGSAYGQTITASGGTAPYTFAVTSGALPPGLALLPTGDLSGVPTTAGVYNFTVTATDANGCTGSLAYQVLICNVISLAPATLPNGTQGVPYSQTITASGGTAPYSFAVTAGSLPAGLSLSAGGVLSGTPTTPGTSSFTVTATDSGGCTGSRAYQLTIDCPTITVAPASLPNGTVGVPYSQTITASGGTAPYTFAVTSGALPPGLALAANGVLSGTPTAVGTYNFTVTATDANACTGSLAYALTINPPGCNPITVSPATLPNGSVGVAYSQTITASGGTAPYTFAVTLGSVPPGLTLTPAGVLGGVPTTAGTYAFTVTATDVNGCTGSQAYSIVICGTITLSPASLPNGTIGTAYSQTITASGGTAPYTFAVTAGALPPGLGLSSGGILSGTPTALGSFNFTVTATDTDGCAGNQAYTIVITCGTITLSPASLPNGTVGVAYSQTITASGGTAPYTFAVTAGALPPGLALSSGGVLSGTPTSAGTFNFTVTATDANGCTGNRAYSLVIGCGTITLSPPSLPVGTVGTAYSQTITASGGTAPYSFAVTAGSLPPGLALSAGGVLSGVPTTAGTFNFTVTATDAQGCTGNLAYSLIINPINCPTITLSPATLPNGTVGTPYSQTITASGGAAPYTFAVTAGTVPTGLSLSAGGVLSGTPAAAGSFAFTVTATDANGCSGSQAYTVTVSCPTITLAPPALPGGTVGTPYSQTITASGGTAPYTFAVTAGALPPGLALAAGGVLSGTPTTAGSYNFTVTATDANGCTGSLAYTLAISGGGCGTITLSPATLPGGTVGTAYSQTITASGGTAPYTFAVTAGALPAGLALSAGGVLSGTPTAAGSFAFTVTATDSSVPSCAGSQAYTVVVIATSDYAGGQGNGQPNPNQVRVYTPGGTPTAVDFLAYAAGQWGVNVASGDVNGGGYDEIVTGPGPGPVLGPQVRGFDRTGVAIGKVNFFAYGTLKYGVNVATGNVDNDGFDEMVTGAGPGAVFGPHVRGWNFDNTTLTTIAKISFFAYGTLKYGVNVTTGDVDVDPYDEMGTGPGPGVIFGPQVRGWNFDATTVSSINKINFNAFVALLYGVNIAWGDVDGDGFDELVATPGPGPTNPSRFLGFDYDGASIIQAPGFDITPFTTFYGGRVGLGDLLGDGSEDLMAGAGPDPVATSEIKAFDYTGSALVAILPTIVPFSGTYGVNPSGGALGY